MELNSRERFLRLMRGQPVDRAPFFPCFGPWPETLERWHREGLSPDKSYMEAIGFDGDLRHRIPVETWFNPMPPREVLVDEGETQIIVERGVKQRVRKDGGSMPEFLGYPVESPEDWRRVIDWLDPDRLESRFPANWKEFCARNRTRTEPCYAGDLPCGFFGGPRELLGFERLSLWFYDEPDLLREILDRLCELWCRLFARVAAETEMDFFFVWEDMCYKTGPLIGPELFREFLSPLYRRLTETLRRAGVDIIMVDSDGDPRKLIDPWLESGVTCVFPWETQMGLDIGEVRRRHPTLQMIGGVNKHALALGRAAIDQELAKLPPLLTAGRYLPALDHFVPPDVSWDDYRYFCEKLRVLLDRYPPTPA